MDSGGGGYIPHRRYLGITLGLWFDRIIGIRLLYTTVVL